MEDEAVAVAAKDEGDFEGFGVAEGLLDACANGVVVVLCLDDGDGDIGLVVEYVVSAFLCASGVEFSPYIDAAIGEGDFLANLILNIPARCLDLGRDELGADVAFAEVFFIHAASG